jgi:AcrR family transcriptional regulator
MSRADEDREREHRGRGRHRTQPDDPIWMRPQPAGRAPRSREEIAAAAIAVADDEGIEAVSMRRVARELGMGTMSLYHYVHSKEELLDLMTDGIMGEQLVDDAQLARGWRAGLTAIAHATRANFERHPWMLGAMRPRPRAVPGPNALRHFDQSVAAVADIGADLETRMEIVTLIDDYVFGFAMRSLVVERAEEHEPSWVDTVFDYMRRELATGAYPHAQRVIEDNRAAGGRDEDLPAIALDERRFDRGLERLLDGIEVHLRRQRKGR